MAEELEPKPQQPALNTTNEIIATESTGVHRGWKGAVKLFFNEPTKFILALAFLLYFLGFAIWHFYLATFGVTTMPFLQTEYVSAALCFLFLFLGLSVPPFIFFKTLGRTISSSGIINFHKWDTTYIAILFVWYFIATKLIQVFLPDSKTSAFGLKMLTAINIIALIHLAFGIYIFIRGQYFKIILHGKHVPISDGTQKFRNCRHVKYGNFLHYWPFYIGAYLLIILCFNSEIDKGFLMLTLIYWLCFSSASVPGIYDLKETWSKSDFLFRSIIVIGLFLFFLIYIQVFATRQFGSIAKSVGGGKPESAYLNVTEGNLEFIESLGIPEAEPDLALCTKLGPVDILLRTDSEVLCFNVNDTTVTNRDAVTVMQIRSDLIGGITFLKPKK